MSSKDGDLPSAGSRAIGWVLFFIILTVGIVICLDLRKDELNDRKNPNPSTSVSP